MASRNTWPRRTARRVPGLRTARRRTLRRMRSSTRLRGLVKQIFAVDVDSSVPMDVTAGHLLGGVGTESRPVVLIVILGADSDTVERVVDEVAHIQLLGAGFRPVLVLDTPAFAATRRYGYPAELIISRSQWPDPALQENSNTWNEYARERVSLLFDTYRATASVSVGADGLDDADRLVLNALRPVATA